MNLYNTKIYSNPSSKALNRNNYIYVILMLLLLVAAGYSKDGSLTILFIVFLLYPINKPFLLLPILFAAAVSSNFFVLSFSINMSYSRIITIIFIVYSIIYFINTNKYSLSKRKKLGVWLSIILLTLFISTIFSETLDFKPLITMSLNLVLFYFMSLYLLSEAEKNDLMNYMIISALIIGITLIYMLYSGEILITEDERLTLEGVNSNRIAMSIAQTIVIYLFTIFVLRRKIRMIYLVGISLVTFGLVFFLLQTGSRTSVLAVLLTLISIIFLFYTGIKRRNLIVGFFLIGFIVYSISELISGKFELYGVYMRFSLDKMIESKGTHRIDIWFLLFEYVIPQNILFGVGIGADNIKQALGGHGASIKNAAHNIVIDPLTQTGILGLFAIWYMFVYVLKKTIRFFKSGYILAGFPLVLFLVSLYTGIGETMYTTRFIWFAMGLCMLFLPVDAFAIQKETNKYKA